MLPLFVFALCLSANQTATRRDNVASACFKIERLPFNYSQIQIFFPLLVLLGSLAIFRFPSNAKSSKKWQWQCFTMRNTKDDGCHIHGTDTSNTYKLKHPYKFICHFPNNNALGTSHCRCYVLPKQQNSTTHASIALENYMGITWNR